MKPKTGVVPLDVATGIAQNFFKMYYANVENKEIDNQLTVDENGVPTFYLYNYKGGGFLIVSAEYGEMPILANDIGSVFPAKGEQINAGLGMWLLETNGRIKAIREGKIKPSEAAADLWNQLSHNDFKSPFQMITRDDIRRNEGKAESRDVRELPNSGNNCNAVSWTNTQISALTTTEWNQGCGYNALAPEDNLGDCGHAAAGCVAVSMAQIIKFNSFPPAPGVNYGAMPNTLPAFTSTTQTAELIRACGAMVHTTYSAAGSGANTEEAVLAFKLLGYSNDVDYGDYNWHYFDHISNIAAGHPVILRGCTDYSCFLGLWCWGSGNCHAWVSDGYQNSYHPCYANSYSFNMNWGWGGTGNGFYNYPVPRNISEYRNYQYYRKILYNIHQ